MLNYDFTDCLSPLDFELLSKDLLEADLGIKLENFREGRDQGIDLRHAPVTLSGRKGFSSQKQQAIIVQCKRYSRFASLKSQLKNKELTKIAKLNPARYILTTSVSLSPRQVDDLRELLSPFVLTSGDIYGRDRLNSILSNHQDIERKHIKLWVSSAGVLDSIIHAGTHVVSCEEVERSIATAKLYVQNTSFDEALAILRKRHVCIILGLPGIGKTTLARMLLLYFYDRGYDIVKIESDISEARDVGYHNKPRFYYYDDFLGQTAQADKLNKNEDQRLLDFMASIGDSKNSVFVLTTREYILTKAKLHYEKLAREKFDHRTCIIDLSKYSRRIRAQILYNHLHFSKLPLAYIEALIVKRGYLKIVDHTNYNPRLIEYLTDSAWIGEISSDEYLEFFLQKLNNPVDIWEHVFHYHLSDSARHILYTITAMPSESLIRDLELAFNSFHKNLCAMFSIAHSAYDFKNALKELEGTFTATRKAQDIVLVSFKNPSIRDFMQNLLLSGELLSELISSLVFFEQAQWFVETLKEKNPQVSIVELSRHIPQIMDALKKLFYADSCSISVFGQKQWARVSVQFLNPAERLATIASFFAKQNYRDDSSWITTKISELCSKIEAGKLSVSSILASIVTLNELGYLNSHAGKELVIVLKTQVMSDSGDIDVFETLASMIDIFPQSFTEEDLESIRVEYSDYAERYAAECDLTNPDELREEASRIQDIGDFFEVDTDATQDTLREFADEIEEKQQSEWDNFDEDDRSSTHINSPDECSDRELDSIFSTLGN